MVRPAGRVGTAVARGRRIKGGGGERSRFFFSFLTEQTQKVNLVRGKLQRRRRKKSRMKRRRKAFSLSGKAQKVYLIRGIS